jgi:hypothetical protein
MEGSKAVLCCVVVVGLAVAASGFVMAVRYDAKPAQGAASQPSKNGLDYATRRQIFVELQAIDQEANRVARQLHRMPRETVKEFALRGYAKADEEIAKYETLLERRHGITHKVTEAIWDEAANNHWGTKLEK